MKHFRPARAVARAARRPHAPALPAPSSPPAPFTRVEPLESRLLFVAGELDFQFSADGKQTVDFGFNDGAIAVTVDSLGRVIAAGFADGGSSNFAVARFLPNGALDASFNNLASPTISNGDGKLSFTFGGVERATSVAVQADGKIVVGGYTNVGTSGGLDTNDFAIARINSNGTLDNTFSGDGRQTVNFGGDDRANAVVIQPDGKIVVVGQWDGGSSNFAVARLNVNGTLDATFGGGDGKADVTFGGVERANAVALSGTNILVAGMTSAGAAAGNPNNFAVARLTAAGVLDNTFSGDGKLAVDFGADDQATSMAVDRLGRVVLGGFGAAANNFALARLTSAGNLDPSFNDLSSPTVANGDGKLSFTLGGTDRPKGIDIEVHGADPEIYIAGFTNVGGNPDNFAIARVRPSGTLDTGFGGGDGIQITDFGADDEGNALVLQADGKAVVAGSSGGNFALARYLGELDPAFGFDGRQTTDFGATDDAHGVVVDSAGRIIVAGSFDGGSSNFALVRYLPNGALDTTFNDVAAPVPGNGDGKLSFTFGAVDHATSVALQPDGKIVVAGYTSAGAAAGNPNNFAVARVNPDGTLDDTFNGDGLMTIDFGNDDRAFAVAVRSDGKIYVAGQWDGGSSNFAVARINPNGTLDATFNGDGRANVNFGPGTVERANAIALAGTNVYLAGVTSLGGVAGNENDFALVRLDNTGAPDTDFSGDGRMIIDFSDDDHATGVAVRRDGRVVIGGYSNDGASDFAVAQVTAAGVPDTTFGGGDGKLEVFNTDASEFANALALLENGKIVMAGYSNSATNSPNNFAVTRILADGSRADPSFNADGEQHLDFGADDKAFALAVQRDGKVVVAGSTGTNIAVARYDSAPTVTAVYVNSTAWTPAFRSYLEARGLGSTQYGYAIPAGRGQLLTLPWINLNEITIVFSERVNVEFNDLVVHGVNTANYALSPAGFDVAPGVATWRLPAGAFFTKDKLLLNLDADSNNGVRTTSGAALDGDWQSGAFETFPSGDGAAGGDFRFRLNVLPGDVDRGTTVVAADFSQVKQKFFSSTTNPGSGPGAYSPFHDVDGSGVIVAADFSEVKKRFFDALPGPEPVALPQSVLLAAASSPFGSQRIRPADDLLA